MSHWLPYLAHRDCQARSHMARLSYLLHSPQMTPERYYQPLMRALLAIASILAVHLALMLVQHGQRQRLDWHSQRGLSFLQLGLREVQRRLYLGWVYPPLTPLPPISPPTACASVTKRHALDCRIEFSRVSTA